MPFADIGSLGLQETNGCVCYSMPFGFLEQGKTAVFVSDAILFVYLFFSGSLWIHWFSFLSGDGKCLAHWFRNVFEEFIVYADVILVRCSIIVTFGDR